jgi:glycosyltransferase involved in cell wall biosynthesis
MKGSPAISVIVPALNEEKYIMNVFDGLGRQTFRDFETIVVDGNSSDGTRSVARKHARVVVERRKGIAVARNTGARIARGGILVFLDADTKPSRAALEAYIDAFRDGGVVAATGPILPLEKTSTRVRLGYEFVSVLFVKLSILFGRPSVVGSNFAVRKSVFDRVGGFNDKFVTYEDWDLSLKLRKEGRIVYSKDAVVYTSVRRIRAWGISGFFIYHSLNIVRYHLFKKPNDEYAPIR